jgi:hypothetical protein
VDPDPGRVQYASFSRIGIGIAIGIQGMPIRIGINSNQKKKLINITFSIKFHMLS